jgi:hypothetical protein
VLIGIVLCVAAVLMWRAHEKNQVAAKKAVAFTPVKSAIDEEEPKSHKVKSEYASKSASNDSGSIYVGLFSGFLCWGIIFLLLVLQTLMLIWVVRDARNRSVDNGVIWMLLVAVFGLFALLIYFASRPHGRLIHCSDCRNWKLDYAKTCPHCGRATAAS